LEIYLNRWSPTNSADEPYLLPSVASPTARKPCFAVLCDHLQLRQAIEKQLNKGEGSNKFSKAVSFGHSHEFIQGEKEDQEIAEACRRLIKNAIVCWNYLYLSRVLAEEKNEERRTVLLEAMRNGSAATWAHFNLHGEFDFSDERMVDSMGLTPPKNPVLKPG
jgi:Tn3 transposase DDE domain-containing protein